MTNNFFSANRPFSVDSLKICLFGPFCGNCCVLCLEDNTTEMANNLEKLQHWMWAELWCDKTVYSNRYRQSLWEMPHTQTHSHTRTQKTSFSQHLRSVKPLLIPWPSLVQCSCISWSQANTLLFLQHSILITFLCPPSILIPLFSCCTRENTKKGGGDRGAALIAWQVLPSR